MSVFKELNDLNVVTVLGLLVALFFILLTVESVVYRIFPDPNCVPKECVCDGGKLVKDKDGRDSVDKKKE